MHGFVTNVADYVPIEEIFLPDPLRAVGGTPIWQTRWFDWSKRIDEKDYVADLRNAFVGRGCAGCGILIGTSRNGWGGPNRPTQVSTSTDATRYVYESRLDRRLVRINWCNQQGAGIGVRPTADTGIAGVDAFVWVKPPGESDGVSQAGVADPDDPYKVFDSMCGPTHQNRYDDEFRTGAMPNAPHFGRWFPEQFAMLVRNAYPPIG